MKYFSCFSGIGGFEIGIHNAWLSTSSRRDNDRNMPSTNLSDGNGWWSNPTCVGYSEIDKYASSVYQKQFGGTNYGDITKINADELPDFGCLVGGFPCQAFSIAGKRKGFEDTRGTLFFDLARILRAKQPRLFVFENVKGLLSHDNGQTFATIISTLTELGYDVQWQVLNSKNHGVPQNRERVIIVGHLRGTPRPEVFPIGQNDIQCNEVVEQQSQITGTINSCMSKGGNKQDSNSRVLVAAQRGMENRQVLEPRPDENANTLTSVQKDNMLMLRDGRDNRSCLRSGRNTEIGYSGMSIRRLMPVECERLQGFPDNWTKYGINGELISDSQRYKMCGNAVTTNVIQTVFERIFESEENTSL